MTKKAKSVKEEKPPKLFKVLVEFELMVLAHSVDEAETDAEEQIRGGDVYPDSMETVRIKKRADLPHGWLDSVPYGGEDATCGQLLKK